MMLFALSLFACAPTSDAAPDDSAVDDTAVDDTAAAANTDALLVVATVASDYSTGQLATVNVVTGAVTDALLPTTSDPIVETDDGYVFLLDRSSENTVRMYPAGDWSAPIVEFSTGDSTNPQDVARCGDVLVVSTLATDSLGLWDAATGLARGTVDLSAWSDADGSPEADTIVKGTDGDLYVTLNQSDTTSYPWTSAYGTGTVLRVSCDSLTVTGEWTTGPNPSLQPHPIDQTKLLLRTGDYYNADYTAKLDGALYTFDPVAGTISEPHLTEEALGLNIGTVAGGVDGKAILVADDAYSWGVQCLDLATWTATPADEVDSFIGDAVVAPDGRVWVAYRTGYAGNGAPIVEGLVVWDPATCTSAAPIVTAFPPYSLALVGASEAP